MYRLIRRYFLNEDGTVDQINASLNCFENVLYNALKQDDPNRDYTSIFCNDINLELVHQNNSSGTCSTYNLSDMDLQTGLFSIDRWQPKAEDIVSQLQQSIDSNATVAVRTMFDLLPQYYYSTVPEKQGAGNTHYSLVVGYTPTHYCIAETQAMLIEQNAVYDPCNPTILLIPKIEFEQALQVFCEIFTVRIMRSYLSNLDQRDLIQRALHKSVENYEIAPICQTTTQTVYHGRAALKQMIALFSSEYAQQEMSTMQQNYFFLYLMHARRYLLQLCCNQIKSCIAKHHIISLNAALHESMNCWKKLYFFVAKSTVARSQTSYQQMDKQLKNLLLIEDRLMTILSELFC